MSNDVGRPSVLDDEQIVLQIKELILEGNSEQNVADILEIPINTWNVWKWKNYKGFADKLLSYKHERMLLKAETNLEVLMGADDDKVKLDASKFVAETVGKNKGYSKRSEHTGKDGKDLTITFDNAFNDTAPETEGSSTQ